MSYTTDLINTRIAALSHDFETPTGDFGFGSDLYCDNDLTAMMDEVDGDSILAVGQADYRRLTTARGSLVDDEDYGRDVRDMLATGQTSDQVLAFSGQIRNELRKDDRHESIDEVTFTGTGEAFDLKIRATIAAGPYTLTLAITDSATILKELAA